MIFFRGFGGLENFGRNVQILRVSAAKLGYGGRVDEKFQRREHLWFGATCYQLSDAALGPTGHSIIHAGTPYCTHARKCATSTVSTTKAG